MTAGDTALTWDDVIALLAGAPPAHLATVGSDGHPHVSIVAVGVEGDHLWFVTRARSGKARNLAVDPRLALVVSANRAETYLRGTGEVVADRPTVARVWSAGILPVDPSTIFGSPDNPEVVMVRVTPTSVSAMVAGPEGLHRCTWTAPG